jgi:hypothetical protein
VIHAAAPQKIPIGGHRVALLPRSSSARLLALRALGQKPAKGVPGKLPPSEISLRFAIILFLANLFVGAPEEAPKGNNFRRFCAS